MVNPYTALYGAYQVMYGNPYQALYGYTAPLGASSSHHKKYKKMLHLMAKRIRLKKKLSHTGDSKKQAALVKEIKMLAKQVKKLRADLQNDGVNTQAADAEAATIEATAPDADAQSDSVSRMMHPHKRRMGSMKRRTRRMGSSKRTTMHAKRSAYRKHRMPHRAKRIKGRQGIRTSAVRHHKYALKKAQAQLVHRPGHPMQHRARLPGQRAFDGRRRSGPISAQEVQEQGIVAQDVDMDDDGQIDAGVMPTMSMPPEMMMATDVPTDVPDIDIDMDYEAPEGLLDGAAMAADQALSGVMDFATGLWGNKFIRYGAIGLGLWMAFGKKLR